MIGKTSSNSLVRALLNFLNIERKDIASIFLLSTLSGLLTLVIPLASQSLVGSLIFTGSTVPLIFIGVVVFILLSVSNTFEFLRILIVEYVQRRIFQRLAFSLTSLISDSFESFQVNPIKNDRDDYSRRRIHYFFELSSLQKQTAILFLEGIPYITQIFFGVLAVSFYHYYFLIFSVVSSTLVILPIWLYFSRSVLTSLKESDIKYEFADEAYDQFKNTQFFPEDLARVSNAYLNARSKHFNYLARQFALLLSFSSILIGLLMGVGGWLVYTQEINLGQFVASELILSAILTNLPKLAKFLESVYDLAVSVYKIEKLNSLRQS